MTKIKQLADELAEELTAIHALRSTQPSRKKALEEIIRFLAQPYPASDQQIIEYIEEKRKKIEELPFYQFGLHGKSGSSFLLLTQEFLAISEIIQEKEKVFEKKGMMHERAEIILEVKISRYQRKQEKQPTFAKLSSFLKNHIRNFWKKAESKLFPYVGVAKEVPPEVPVVPAVSPLKKFEQDRGSKPVSIEFELNESKTLEDWSKEILELGDKIYDCLFNHLTQRNTNNLSHWRNFAFNLKLGILDNFEFANKLIEELKNSPDDSELLKKLQRFKTIMQEKVVVDYIIEKARLTNMPHPLSKIEPKDSSAHKMEAHKNMYSTKKIDPSESSEKERREQKVALNSFLAKNVDHQNTERELDKLVNEIAAKFPIQFKPNKEKNSVYFSEMLQSSWTRRKDAMALQVDFNLAPFARLIERVKTEQTYAADVAKKLKQITTKLTTYMDLVKTPQFLAYYKEKSNLENKPLLLTPTSSPHLQRNSSDKPETKKLTLIEKKRLEVEAEEEQKKTKAQELETKLAKEKLAALAEEQQTKLDKKKNYSEEFKEARRRFNLWPAVEQKPKKEEAPVGQENILQLPRPE